MTGQRTTIKTGNFIRPSAAGAYYAVQSAQNNGYRESLLRLLRATHTPEISEEFLQQLTGLEKTDAVAQFHTLEKAGFVNTDSESVNLPANNLDTLLPDALPQLSDQGRVALVDSGRGFYLGHCGFTATEAEELAVMSAGIRILYERNQQLLQEQLSIVESAFGIIDPAGHSELGFWPIFVGDNVFTLIIAGLPSFNCLALKQLIWVLVHRYGQI